MKINLIPMVALHFKHQMIFFLKEMGNVFIQNKKNQRSDTYCTTYCLLILYLTNIKESDFKPAALRLYFNEFGQNEKENR